MRGLVIGKFLPFHRGHEYLITVARQRCDDITVIVCDAAWHTLDVDVRADWITESFPDATVLTVDQDNAGLSDDDSEGWARLTVSLLGTPPDVVFSSEDYGPVYAGFMGAQHTLVDRDRQTVPISGTKIRANPLQHLDQLAPQVRAHFVRRVCILGAESTGKTTLGKRLVRDLDAAFVPEFGRLYTEAMPEPTSYTWTPEDFNVIATTQSRFEDDAARWSGPVLICDTNSFVTAVFREAYLGAPDTALEAAAVTRRYDLFLLCDINTPFEQDITGLRQDGTQRSWMHDRHLRYLANQPTPWVLLSGSPDDRVSAAKSAITACLETPAAAEAHSR